MGVLPFESRAKINIGLKVTGKRSDGYHNIESLFQEIDLSDSITFQKTSGSIIIHSDRPSLPIGKENLMYRAFDVFKKKLSISEGIEIDIEKHIPIGGGLGGGSSNAAATLKAANALWGKPFSNEQLKSFALEIGSDVPFFISGGTAIGRGRGEELTLIDIPDDWYAALVCSGISISTKWVYDKLKIILTNEEKISNFNALLSGWRVDLWQKNLPNDLEIPVFKAYPELRKIKERLYKEGAFYASMSGSGSTVYGLFKDRETGYKARQFFSKKYVSYICRPITNHLNTDKSEYL